MGKVVVFDHPLVQHKISILRNKDTNTKDFRELVEEIAMLMAYEATRDLPLEEVEIETPICKTKAKMLTGHALGIVPIWHGRRNIEPCTERKSRTYRSLSRPRNKKTRRILLQAPRRRYGARFPRSRSDARNGRLCYCGDRFHETARSKEY